MSRIIIKNVPKVFTEKEIVDHFSKVDQITDCRLLKNEQGQSRRLAFVGFKDKDTAQQLKQKYDNTYLGASKIRVEIARLPGQQQQHEERSRTRQKQNQDRSKSKQPNVTKTFEAYKQIIQQQVKKSWDDLIVPQQPVFDEPEEETKPKKKSKSEPKAENIPEEKQEKKPVKSQEEEIKPIKAPRLSEKNKKFVTKPLQIDSNRLYITNIPYTLSEEDIRSTFSRFGAISKVKLPKQYDGKNKGFFFITYQKSEEALRAFSEMDNKVVFGRIIHIKPSLEDIGQIIKTGKQSEFQQKIKEKYGDTIEEKSSFKKRKKREMREKLNDTTNWNTLFLNPNTILERMAKKLHITKSEILLSDDLAPKIALAEAEVIQQTKDWMTKEGNINLDFLEKDRNLCERSKKTLLIKNLNYRTQQTQLKELLQFYGVLQKLLISPNRAIAIAEFQNPDFAANVMQNLQNHKFKNNFIYLQYAPLGMITEEELTTRIEKVEKEAEEAEELSKVVYMKNLNFQTQEATLYEIFEKIAPIKYAKIVKGKEGKSMGFGFVQYESHEKAVEAVKKLNNVLVDGHKLNLSLSRKKVQSAQDLKALKEKIKQEQLKSSKLLVKNLAFQATQNQLKQLFTEYGSIKKIRLPKKMDGQHRGFAFVQFDSVEEAALAKSALSSAHLYGRKLVIQYEKGSNNQ